MQQVSQEWFREKFTELCTLMGWSVSDNRKVMIYEELINFDRQDFLNTFNRLKGEDKFVYAVMWKTISEQRARRVEKETHDKQMKEEDEVRAWFREHQGTKSECINNYSCGDCKRTYCDIVSINSIQAIKDMITGDVDRQVIHRKLADKFHGIGFEKNVPELEPF